MATLWDEVPAGARSSGALDPLRPLLEAVSDPEALGPVDEDGFTWRRWRATVGDGQPLGVDLATGTFHRGATGPGVGGQSPLELPDPGVEVTLWLREDAGGDLDGSVRVDVETPSAVLRLPFLRGAFVDAQGQLRADPANPQVRFLLPALRVRTERLAGQAIDVQLLSASTTGADVDRIFEFVRMEPAHALVGPGDVVGFAFRAAVLDLSTAAGPPGLPAGARAMPAAWQGLHLPEVRLFVAPTGMEGLACSAGVRDLWIGVGRHAGVTGLFEAEVVHRGQTPTLRLRFQTPAGEWIGVPDDAVDGTTVPVPDGSRAFADAGGGIAPIALTMTAGAASGTDRVAVDLSGGPVTVRATARDAGAHERVREVVATLRPAPAGAPPAGTQPVAVRTTSATGSRVVLVSQTATEARLRLEPEGGDVEWALADGTVLPGPVVPVAAGATVGVRAVRRRPAAAPVALDAFTLFDRPAAGRFDTVDKRRAWAGNPDNQRLQPASSRDGFTGAEPVVSAATRARIAALPAGTTWTVEGWASFEDDERDADHNLALSRRRRDALVLALVHELGVAEAAVTAGAAHGHGPARDGVSPDPGAAPDPESPRWWRARATATPPAATEETVTAELVRPPALVPAPVVDPPPTRPPLPVCFRRLGVRVELVRGTFVRAELFGELDVRTAAESRLAAGETLPGPANPSDGITTFLVRLRLAEDRSSWEVAAEVRAVEADRDGLWSLQRPSGGGSAAGMEVLGALAVFGPLLAQVPPPSPDAGDLVPLALATGAAAGLGLSPVLETQRLVLHGGEVVVTDGLVDPASGTGPRTTQVSVLLDVETAFTFDLSPLISVDPSRPITTRSKALGVRATWDTVPGDGDVEHVPLPVFDPSRGYTLDVPAGSLVTSPPILRAQGLRVSRDNPTLLEVEVGMGVDLGPVRVDSARVRIRIDEPGHLPELTKLAATLDVPGTLHGSGYVEITAAGFKGAFDLSIVPLNVRGSAALAVETIGGVTGVLVGLEVQFPVPIPLGSSGIGLYGLLGGVGANYRRDERTDVQVPALRWLEDQLTDARQFNVMHPAGWRHEAGSFAFAAGLLVGTMEGGFVTHVKGIVLIEVPGPRLLVVAKADVLKPPPLLKAQSSATFLAVLDIDFGRGTITLAVVAQYEIERLLRVRVPATAFFDTRHPERWSVDLGTFDEPVTVELLQVFRGTGYLMVHGDGIAHPRLPIPTAGLTIAVGFHLEAVLMGSKAAGLYFEVAAGFDALVSFAPFAIGGKIYARGELRLWVVGISASAELTVLVGRQRLPSGAEVERTSIHGEVCGEVDLFFFEVRGCVSLTLGETPPDEPVAPPLVAGVSLVSRSPALVEGTATDRAVDGRLADAVPAGDPAPLPSVPLDAVPVVLFEVPPLVAPGDVVLGGQARGASGAAANPWVRRGDRWWRYRVTSVELVGDLQPAPPAGKTPATWWARGAPGDPQHGPALALLSWLPTPTPRAVPYGERLVETVRERWGSVCLPAAPPAPVLWTFDGRPVGPSPAGWRLAGLAWPDPPGTVRSSPVDAPLDVREPWRTGDPLADLLQGTSPAVVVGDAVPCEPLRPDAEQPLKAWLAGQPSTFGAMALPTDGEALEAVAELLADGASLADVPAVWVDEAWSPTPHELDCEGRVLRSPAGDHEQAAPDALPEERELVERARAELGFSPSPLEAAVRLRAEHGLAKLALLLLVPARQAHQEAFALHLRGAKGDVLAEQHLTPGDLVGPGRPLPGAWLDPGGPWLGPFHRSMSIAARIAVTEREHHLALALVELDVPDGVVEVELGWRRGAFEDGEAPPFWVVAAEGVVTSEGLRFAWDETTQSQDRDVLQSVLTQDPDDHALLVPGRSYAVRVQWESQSVRQDEQPPATHPESWTPGAPQEHRFVADPATAAPRALAPWVLASAPSAGETGVLCAEPLRIAFATQNVARLFAAYGEELRVQVRSASGRHPAPAGGGPGEHVAVPLDLPALAGLAVRTPWEDALIEVAAAELPCIDVSVDRERHTVLEVAYDLDPLTDHLLDVVAVPLGAPAGAAGRLVHRVGFTTSRYARVGDLAGLTRFATIEHRLVPVPGALAGLPAEPSGAVLDDALAAAGLGVPQVPRTPRVQVLWSPDAVPQPVAVVVESSEAMWRERPMPVVVAGPSDASDPDHAWWAARPRDWLSLQVAPPGAPGAATVTRLVEGPGGTRAVALLAPGSRGKEVRLDLVVAADELAGSAATTAAAARVPLRRAPWEEED